KPRLSMLAKPGQQKPDGVGGMQPRRSIVQRFVLRAMILLLAAVWAYGLMVRAATPVAAGGSADDLPLANVLRVGSGVSSTASTNRSNSTRIQRESAEPAARSSEG